MILAYLTLAAALACALPAPAHAASLYVAPEGNDAWSGRLQAPNADKTDGPLVSLVGARDAVRKLKAAGPLKEPVRVEIAHGVYELREPLVFTPRDSGTEACPIIYENAPDARPVFAGGKRIFGFKPGPGELWVATLPEGDWRFEDLWVNGRRAVRARTPNVVRLGETCVPRYSFVARKVGFGIDPLTGRRADLSQRAFIARPEDIKPLLGLSQAELAQVCLVVYHAWESSRHHIAAVDPQTNTIYTTGPSPWAFQWLGPNQRFHLEGLKSALDQPGEWYLEKGKGGDGLERRNGGDGSSSRLYYWPLAGEDMAEARVVAPVVDHLVEFVGQQDAGLPVEHIILRGLAFHYAGYTLAREGHGDGQAAVSIPAAIMADGARNIRVERCELAHVGTYGVWFRRGCSDCAVSQSHLYDLGAGGVKIGEPGILPEPDRTHHITVDSNLIHAGGRIFTGAVGVWIGQSGDNSVTHNDISDLFYSGISVGWSWGYADTISKRNKIEYNHIHHLGWGVMSDMGGVYTLGIADGTTVSNNVIHDINSYNKFGYAGLGLYNDEGTTHITMENNLVYDTLDMTYHQHYGKENVVRNNILVDGKNFQISVHRPEAHLSSTFEHNIVCFKSGTLFWAASLDDRKLKFDSNLYWNSAGKPFDFMGMSLQQWQKLGQDKASLIADPLFVDPEHYDFHLKPESPALKLGFKPFDYTQAGIQQPPGLAALARKLSYPPVEFAPDPPAPPPLVIDDGFEDYPVGAPPLDASVNAEGKGDTIAVTDETAASGKQSLKFTDAPGLQYSFDPHLVYNPQYSEGIAHCSFDLRLEEGAELWHEYRDWTAPAYTVGPSLQVTGGKLKARDTVLMDVPVGQWIHMEVTVSLGAKANDRYDLTVTLPGKKPRRFAGLPCVNPGWKKLTWIGFVSNATKKTVFYLDNVRLGNGS